MNFLEILRGEDQTSMSPLTADCCSKGLTLVSLYFFLHIRVNKSTRNAVLSSEPCEPVIL
jgi:hypothetical protein